MSTFIKLSALSFLTFIIMSCDASKKTTNLESNNINTTENMEMTKAMDTKLQNEGYAIGKVMYVKNSDCPYIIVDEKSGEKFDPTNIDTKAYSLYKKDNEPIYFKCRRLRMAPRCNNIQVVEIADIKKRKV